MSLVKANGAGDQSTGFYKGAVEQSGRFFGTTGYIDHQFGTPTSTQKMILAFWVKPSEFGDKQNIFGGGASSTNYVSLSFSNSGFYNANDQFKLLVVNSNSNVIIKITNRLFRDPSAWMHVCVAIDTTQDTAADRVLLYFNGIKYTGGYASEHNPSENQNLTQINSAMYHQIGLLYAGANYGYFDGYLADFYFLDGQSIYSDTSQTINSTFLADADTLATFCEQKNGVAIPKAYTGATSTYGNNGFRLEFKNNTAGGSSPSSSTFGADTSGKDNHFNDYSTNTTWQGNCADSPENNFCTLNPLGKQSASTLSLGALRAYIASGTNSGRTPGTFAVPSGKWYWEVRQNSSNRFAMGVFDTDRYVMTNEDGGVDQYEWVLVTDDNSGASQLVNNSNYTSGYGGTVASGHVVMVALDVDNGAIWFGKQGSWFNKGTSDNSATVKSQIEAGTTTNAAFTGVTGRLTPSFVRQTSNNDLTVNFGQDDTFQTSSAAGETTAGNTDGNGFGKFQYEPPSGFLALCSSNLPDLTIGPDSTTNIDDHFNTFLYTGTNATNRNLAENNFTPDWVWLKSRSQADNHVVIDVLRKNGSNFPNMHPNLTDVEANDTHPKRITNGIQVSGGLYDNNSVNFVVWNWKAGGDPDDVTGNFIKDGVAFTPTQGTIDANRMSVNTTAGFSIIEFTSDISSDVGETGTPPTIAHGLGVKPKWVIIKDRDGGSYPHWNVWHPYYQPDTTYLNYQLFLELTNQANNAGWHRTDSGFTTNLFTPPRYQYNENGKSYIAYVFHEVEGFSKFGGYIGNNSTDGPFVHLGFEPQFLIIKRASDSGAWQLLDNKRNPFNPTDIYLYTPGTGTEVDGSGLSTPIIVDFLSNGFKVRSTEAVYNSSGASFAYMAFAEKPFKFSNGK